MTGEWALDSKDLDDTEAFERWGSSAFAARGPLASDVTSRAGPTTSCAQRLGHVSFAVCGGGGRLGMPRCLQLTFQGTKVVYAALGMNIGNNKVSPHSSSFQDFCTRMLCSFNSLSSATRLHKVIGTSSGKMLDAMT